MSEYTIYMYIYDEYQRFKTHYKNINEFVYKNRISSIIQYYKENINPLGNQYNIQYHYYNEIELNVLEIIQDKISDPFIPPYRLLIYNDIKENSFGIHRYGWKNVIANFISQNYWEKNDFYYNNPGFEWVSYALEYNLDDFESAKKHYLENIAYKSEMKYKPMKYIIFDEWLEKKYIWKSNEKKPEYKYPFISFIHDPPLCQVSDDIYDDFKEQDTIQLLKNNEDFTTEVKYLKILITLSSFHKNFIERNKFIGSSVNIQSLYHPLEISIKSSGFNIEKYMENKEKSLFFIGWWLRKYDIFLRLSCNKTIIMKHNEGNHVGKYITKEIRKIIGSETDQYLNTDLIGNNLINSNINEVTPTHFTEREKHIMNITWNTKICGFIESEKYDKLFSNNICFLDIYACSANNILLECIINCTPILVCYNLSIIEYLGIDYPFYFTNYEDAEHKSKDIGLILKTHYYLRDMDKKQFTYRYFNDELRKIITDNI